MESQGCSPEDAQTYLLLEHLPLPTSKVPCDEENRLHCHATLPPSPKTLVPKAALKKSKVPLCLGYRDSPDSRIRNRAFSLQTPAQVGKKEMLLSPGAETPSCY